MDSATIVWALEPERAAVEKEIEHVEAEGKSWSSGAVSQHKCRNTQRHCATWR